MDGDSVIQDAIRSIIKFIGDNPDSEHCKETPQRVERSYAEIFGGYKTTPEMALGTTFDAGGYDQMVICKGIEMYSTCSHHMIPFFGSVNIGYVPGTKIVGLSKLARLVDAYSRRLQVQERLTDQIASALDEVLKPRGVMVTITAKHLCMCARGVKKQNSEMVTSALRGVFAENPETRAEFLELTT